MTYDPFDVEIEPLSPVDDWAVLTSTLQRSMMWDLIGPHKMRDNPTDFGQNPASADVLEAEYKEMMERRHALMPFGSNFSLMCYIAAESASQALMKMEPKYSSMSDEEKMQFRTHNVNIGVAIAGSVIGHMLQNGLIHHGEYI